MQCKKCGAAMVWDKVEKVYLCLSDGTRVEGPVSAPAPAPADRPALHQDIAEDEGKAAQPAETKPSAEKVDKPGNKKRSRAIPTKLEDYEPGATRDEFFAALRKVSAPLDLRAAIAQKLDQHQKVELDDLSALLVRSLTQDPEGTLKALGFFGKTFSANDVWDAASIILVEEVLKRTPGAEEVSPGRWRWSGGDQP